MPRRPTKKNQNNIILIKNLFLKKNQQIKIWSNQ
jgi:hypothetical protein